MKLAADLQKYKQVKEYIVKYMIKEKLNIHNLVFTENRLANKFHVSRYTIRKALDELEKGGWIYRKRGVGTICADRSEIRNFNCKNIAVITAYINNYVMPRIIKGIAQVLSKDGYTILIYTTNNQIEKETDILQNILTKDIKGVIIEPTKSALPHKNLNYFQELKKRKIPYIFINSYYDELRPSYVIQDDEAGGFIATEHLVKLGHQNIMGIFKSDDKQGLNRYKGYVKALRYYDIRINEDNIIWYTTEEIKTKPLQRLGKIFKREGGKPTAVICYNDQIAMWVIEALRKLGLSIPNDVSIVGFDDSDCAVLSDIKITSVIHPKEEMGRQAAEILLKLMEMGSEAFKEPINMCIKPELKVRMSTRDINFERKENMDESISIK